MEDGELLLLPQPVNANRKPFFLSNARKFRKYAPLYVLVTAPLAFAFAVQTLIFNGRYHTGQFIEVLTKFFFYTPVILFIAYSLAVGARRETYQPSGSLALRLLACFLSILGAIYELSFILSCEVSSSMNTDTCNSWTLAERAIALLYLLALGLFVLFNGMIPRENVCHLFMLAHMCASVIYGYMLICVLEESYIYNEILEHIKPHVYRPRLVIRATGVFKDGECSKFSCVLEHFLEMFYTAIAEFLVVVVSIVISIIYEAGKPAQFHWRPPFYNKRSMLFWVVLVGFSVVIELILIYLNVAKSKDALTKYAFLTVHLSMLTAGGIMCGVFLVQSEGHHGAHTAADKLDRYLLYFGTTGMLFYTFAGLVHSASLIPTEYSTKYAVGSLLVNSFSLVQVLLQSIALLHRDFVRSHSGFLAGIVLWVINFGLFCLDLFDAAELGIFANPVPHDSNVAWTMFVRGLGPFDVFYRFHSLAIIAENIEHHLRPHRAHVMGSARIRRNSL